MRSKSTKIKETQTQVFSYEYCEIFFNTYLETYLNHISSNFNITLREKCPNAEHSSSNTGKYEPEKPRIWTIFTQCKIFQLIVKLLSHDL